MSERRAARRNDVGAEYPIAVSWSDGGTGAAPVTAAMADASNVAFAAVVSGAVSGTETGQRTEVRLTWAGGEATLADAEVVRVQPGAGSTVVVFGLAHQRDRDALWLLRDRCRRGGAAAVPARSQDRPDPVPGRGHYSESARLERLRWLRERTGERLDAFTSVPFDPTSLSGNIENLVGAVSVPVGLAGPLLVTGEHVSGEVVAPFATTEGALVASATRGALAVSRAGGAHVQVLRQLMTRSPAFTFESVAAAAAFGRWLGDHHDEIAAEAAVVSGHARLVALEAHQTGPTVHVRFAFDTADAAGQNMTTACTARATGWILGRLADHPVLRPLHSMVEGNLSGDKKLNWLSPVSGRGVAVTATVTIPADVLREVLKVSAEQITRGYHVGLSGTLASGTVGYDINAANAIAAIFTATGQDIACVHESSVAYLDLQRRGEDLFASLTLPCLVVGTIGGGTHLPAQRDALRILGCDGAGHVGRLAEIVAGFCLALDLSTLAAVCGGQFVAAHERLGRNRPVRFFGTEDLTPAFFADVATAVSGDPAASVVAAEAVEAELEDSILTEITSHRLRHLVGLHPYRLSWRSPSGGGGAADVVVKVKPVDAELQLLMRSLASACGDAVADALGTYEDRLAFRGSHLRELEIYDQTDPRFCAHAPTAYRTYRDDAREAYVVVLDLVRPGPGVRLLNSGASPGSWGGADIDTATRGLAALHAIWFGRDAEVFGTGMWGPHLDAVDMKEMSPLWDVLVEHAAAEFGDLVPAAAARRCRTLVARVGDWWNEIEKHPRTLTHGDFNPRNICLRTGADGVERLCAFDWELACWHLPQRDLAELLAFTLDDTVTPAVVDAHVEVLRLALQDETGAVLDPRSWRRGYTLGLYDFAVNRLMLYLMGHTVRDFAFLAHVCATTWRLLEIEAAGGAPELCGAAS